jgi:hypothetical protein
VQVQKSACVTALRSEMLELHCLGSNSNCAISFLWASGKLFNLSVPPFSHLSNREQNGNYPMRCSED